jgi:hypothetical protein
MSVVPTTEEPLDESTLRAIMIRWKLAEQFLMDIPEAAETGNMAIHVLVAHDLPVLVEEIARLRPDLV